MLANVRPTLASLAIAIAFGASSSVARAQATIDAYAFAGSPIIKSVHSMREIRYRDVVSQQFDFSCGSAALSTLLKYGYGIDIPETEMIRRMMAFSEPEVVVKHGFSMLDMKKFVETLGLRGRGFRVGIEALYRLRIPVLVLMNINGYEHFVIVKHAENGRIFLADPALGNRIVLEQDFAKSWNGLVFAVLGKPFREDSPLLQHNESLALKLREQALNTGTAAIPFVEFGLIKADLF
ncbi:C39 family peptidase [Burkholderia thailandensis]|uniref:C39 family peptidase n=1 Tax=Burkholderia thailandensis TaxID=57975 RepID=UPI00046D1A99|nr:C39 family peptidase [Burkholderia thailandensis]AOJ51515.1 peptidase C39 [Burkholderia thailandensis]AVR23852.1 peptidase C39 [Burkholderia thailandensis]MCZ2894871.1 C39 family peptidase [Burkholderia thailandensis]TGB35588.1 peptidase C39 [Burkholderia thailandensis]